MRRHLSLVLALFVGCLPALSAGCSSEDLVQQGDEEDVTSSTLAVKTVKTKAAYQSLAFADGGVILPGKTVKFLIDNRAAEKPSIFYMNANFKEHGETPDAARFHYYFAERILSGFDDSLEVFNESTYSKQDKRYYAGTVQTYQYKGKTIYGVQLYPEDVAKEETIIAALKMVKKSFTIAGAQLAFVATGPQQTTKTIDAELSALGILDLTIDQVLDGIAYLPMNQGEAWGYLRLFPTDSSELTPADIPVFDELPLDLAVVAGTITKAFQDASCHVNLKSKERGTPDMVLRDATANDARLKVFAGKPVHLVVGPSEFTIEATTDAIVAKKLAEKLTAPWTPVPYEPATALLSYAEMCASNAADCLALNKKYGTKSANLGFMTNKHVLGRATDSATMSAKVGYDLVPAGFGVPLKLYRDFVDFAPNSDLRAKIKKLVEAELSGAVSPKARAAMVAEVQSAFYVAKFPAGVMAKLDQELTKVLPNLPKFKVRSSANAEDLQNFDGAGLYDSFSVSAKAVDNADGSCQLVPDASGVATKADMSPKTFACAVKGVYASLWNKRAVEERSFAHFDHATATMGLAIVPKYDLDSDIASNSVVVTRVLSSKDVFGYTFATQVGDDLVTNPTPGTLPEEIIVGFADPKNPPSFVVTHFAVPTPGAKALGHTVMTDAQMKLLLQITQTVETAYCKNKPSYYGGDCGFVTLDNQKPSALDFEFKLLANGHFIAKQVREFGG